MTCSFCLGLFSDPMQKLVELAKVFEVEYKGLHEQWPGTAGI